MQQQDQKKIHKYHLTVMSAMKWAKHELNHIGKIASVEDPDIQYSYAMSTLNGMLHLRNALRELVSDPAYSFQREDLLRTHDQVVRAIKHLIKDYSLDVNTIQLFNTRGVLGDLSNVKGTASTSPSMQTVNTRSASNKQPTWANVSAAKLAANKVAANKVAANKVAANKVAANANATRARSNTARINARPANVKRNNVTRKSPFWFLGF
uniref:Uncharacterized protein n=1 Tax=viral metagenome TaxID=1070528 RepID=A0A6C0L7D2_9ZZZZ